MHVFLSDLTHVFVLQQTEKNGIRAKWQQKLVRFHCWFWSKNEVNVKITNFLRVSIVS